MNALRNLTLFPYVLLLVGSAFGQAAPPRCIPLVNGYPEGLPIVHQTARYCHVYQMCNNKDGTRGWVEGISAPGTCSQAAIAPAVAAVHAATAKVGTAHAQWRQTVRFGCNDPKVYSESSDRGTMCRERNAEFAANRERWWPLPAGGEWRK